MTTPLDQEVSQYCCCSLECLSRGGIIFLRQKLNGLKRNAKKGKSKFSLQQINAFEKRAIVFLGMSKQQSA